MSIDPRERDHDALEANAKRAFDASVERLDGPTRSRLGQARAAAMAAATAPARQRWPLSVGALRLAALGAAAALAIAVVWLPGETPAPAAVELTAFDDLDILLDEEELDLFEELEFYAWLEAQALAETAGDADGAG